MSVHDVLWIISGVSLVVGLVMLACGWHARRLLERARRLLQRAALAPDPAERRRLVLQAEGLIDSAERWLPTMWLRLIRRRAGERARPPR